MEEQKSTAGQGLGIAGLVLGIIALILSFIPCIGWVAIIPGFIAIALCIVGLTQANKANGAKGLIIAALVISILGTSIALLQGIFFAGVATEGSKWKNKIEKISKDFGDEFEEEFGEELEKATEEVEEALEEVGEDLEDALEKLEEGMEDTLEELSDEEKAKRLGRATGKALKEFVKEVQDTSDNL